MMPDALQVLREDHNKVKDLFQRFEKTEARAQKKQIADQAIMELMVHAQIEEEIFYPSMKKQLGDVDLLHEAEEEHHVAEVLMEELTTMRLNDKSFDAKFMVLAENVKHHIGEEEGEMFPKAAEAGRQTLDRVGQMLMERKMELMEEMRRPRKRTATGSRNGRSRAGRTARTTARSRSTSTSRSRTAAAKKGGRSTARSTSGTRSRTTSGRGRSATSRSRSGGSSRARSTTSKRTTTARRGTRTSSRRR
jgi:hemerythrin superfamily protein